jgi:hypothetical protein
MLLDRIKESKVLLLQVTLTGVVQLWQQREISLRKTKVSSRQVGIGANYLSKRLPGCPAIKTRTDLLRRCWLGQARDHKGGESRHSRKEHPSLPNFHYLQPM